MSVPKFLVPSRRRSSSASSRSSDAAGVYSMPEISSLLVCNNCRTHLCPFPGIISKAFTGRQGRAVLCANVANVLVGRPHERMLATGMHTVADIACMTCNSTIGWKYVAAHEPTQKYKVGKYILETGRTVKVNTWDQ